jgi:N6-adenosine-specific RNA methylase IME4
MPSLPISRIKVRSRFRKELGDIQPLAESIKEVGLLHPIVVRRDGRLIAGERRLRACEFLGWKNVPVNVIDIDQIVRGEFAENAYRMDFLPSEVDAIRGALEPLERAAAKKRMSNGGKGVKISQPCRTLDRIGSFAGLSGRSVEKIRAIMEAARREPKRFAPLVEEMDRTRKVDGPYRTFRQWLDAETRTMLRPVRGKYRTIVIDCPWQYPGKHRGRPDYATISHQELMMALPVRKWADVQCHLYLWSTNGTLPQALDLMGQWGFQFKNVLTWLKPGLGLGAYFRTTTEQCLFGVKGNLLTRPPHNIPTHFQALRTRHSEKPEEFYHLVHRASYAPFLEVFARKKRPGWTCWGNVVERG